MENLDEYILRYQQYKKGNYEYDTINSPYDVKRIVESGKRIVFIGNNRSAIWLFGIGLLYLIIGLIVEIIFFLNSLSLPIEFRLYAILYNIFLLIIIVGIPFIFFLMLGLWYMRKRFIVLGSEGLVYKLRSGGVKGYSWKDVNVDFYNYSFIKQPLLEGTVKTVKIHIFMPDGYILKVEPDNYLCKEIPMNKFFIILSPDLLTKIGLFMLLFNFYSNYGKYGTIEGQKRGIEEQRKIEQTSNENINTEMLVIDEWKEKLKETFYNYKRKKYNYGTFWNYRQIQKEILRNKIFVLRGAIRLEFWIAIIGTLGVIIPAMITMFPFAGILGLVIPPIIWFFVNLPFLFLLTRFLVISSSGVYYRKFIRKHIFSWNAISKIDGITPKRPTLIVNLLTGKKIKFMAHNYRSREFPKKVYPEMFLSLFNSNFKLVHQI
jgi:hypothetical protein